MIIHNCLIVPKHEVNKKETNLKNIYFSLRLGLVNTINTYLRLISCLVQGEICSLKYIFIEFAIPNLSLIYCCILEIFITTK